VSWRITVNRIRFATAAALLASFFSLQVPAEATDQSRKHREKQEEKWERQREREERREAKRDARDAREARRDRIQSQREYWDAARYYRNDNGYRARRLSRNDYIYRGSDNRYYCRRDDGTTGLIIGGIAGGVLGHIIAPGGAKTLGTIIGAGGGALLGRAIDDGDVVCR
jgi:hypothetical protein